MDGQWYLFCAVMGATSLLSLFARSLVLSRMRKVEGLSSATDVHPVELAYLFRPGDSAHCLIVLLVDSVHKELKQQQSGDFQLSKILYEAEVWPKVRAYIKDWSMQKAQQLVPEITSKNPLKVAGAVWRLREWFWNAIKGLFSEIIQDPLHLRKYFSPVGLVKLFVSVAGTGVKETLSSNVRRTLLTKKLLVEEDSRNAASRLLTGIASVHLIAIACVVYFAGIQRADATFLFILFALFNGFMLRLLSWLPTLLPHFDEISKVLGSVSKKGFRISLVRSVFGTAHGAFWLITGIFGIGIGIAQAAVLGYFFGMHTNVWVLNFAGIALLSLNFLVIFELCFRSLIVASTEQTTDAGVQALELHHQELKDARLVQAISAAMSNPSYSEELSDIVAIYGIETLFLV